MKRLSFFAFLFCILLLLSSCRSIGNWVPENVSDDLEPYASHALEIIDKYLSFEIDSYAASAEFEELSRRIESCGINPYSAETSSADSQTIQAIRNINLFCFSAISNDEDVFLYRDILLFQLGQEVSGRSYPSTKVYLSDDSESYLSKFVDVGSIPFSDAFVFYNEDTSHWQVSLTFDKLNGILVEDLEKYIFEILDGMYSNSLTSFDIILSYQFYGQNATTICVTESGTSFIAYSLVSTNDRKNSNNTIYEIDSYDDISILLQETAHYVENK